VLRSCCTHAARGTKRKTTRIVRIEQRFGLSIFLTFGQSHVEVDRKILEVLSSVSTQKQPSYLKDNRFARAFPNP